MIGRPVHYMRSEGGNWTACGVQSDLAAWDYRHVECLRCRKTKVWKRCVFGDREAYQAAMKKQGKLQP